MSEINYQALREAAERAIPAMERLLMLPADDDLLSEQELKDYGVDIDALNAFKFLAGPETVLALLDERERNQQYIKRRDQENEDIALTVGKLRVELEETKSKLNKQREYYEGVISDGSKRIAELEAREVVLPRAHDVHPLGLQSAKIFCEFHRSIVNRCADEIRKVGVKVSIKGN
ncbi:ead/Ea22-like family protein [Escherichia coli]|nr:ead/Ea22-like family protein [Escherichia coli]